jgi:Tfp pilus assembly protein PilE
MGQQQLLLVILVTIIVGVATVVAINTFSAAADSANLDAVRQDLATIASSAQAYYMKPGMMNGGGNSFENIEWQDIGSAPCNFEDNTNCVNENGTYALGAASSGELTITAYPSGQDGYTADGTSSPSIEATVQPNNISMGDLSGGSDGGT